MEEKNNSKHLTGVQVLFTLIGSVLVIGWVVMLAKELAVAVGMDNILKVVSKYSLAALVLVGIGYGLRAFINGGVKNTNTDDNIKK